MRDRKSKYGMVDITDMRRMVLHNDYSREVTPGKLVRIKEIKKEQYQKTMTRFKPNLKLMQVRETSTLDPNAKS